ncbi:Sas10 C-terminal domain-containing protein [Gongronella butleri]|nr:Sas10 C-terminal domain-containing protein [Gongronella butleri]
MGKKKAAVFRDASKNAKQDDGDKIRAIRTWDDIEHESEDDFHDSRGQILLDDQQSEAEEESDREIYGLDGIDDQQDEDDDDEFDDDEGDDEEIEDTTWGASKKAYYDADEGEDLDEMREEETEALKIQKQRLADMDEADFMDDTLAGWGVGAQADQEADKALVASVTKDLDDISFDMSKSIAARRKNLPVAEKLKILQNESPELLDLLNEFKDKSESVSDLERTLAKIAKHDQMGEKTAKFLTFQYQLYMNYLTNISFYFVLKAHNTSGLRDHPVIQTLVSLRQAIEKSERVEKKRRAEIDDFLANLGATPKPAAAAAAAQPAASRRATKAKRVAIAMPTSSESDVDADADVAESNDDEEQDTWAAIHDIEEEFKSMKKQSNKRKRDLADDFGELDAMEQVDMEDKLQRKRSIRDYVAKIESKQAKQLAKYQGDSDLPYKDRKFHQQKGVAQPKDTSADLDNEDWDEKDERDARDDQDNDDDDYTKMVRSKKSAKAQKQAEYDAMRAPLVEATEHVDDGEKRQASWKILKNKGLTPRRKKEDRNSRVKKRHQYDKKLKKLSSTRQIHKPLAGSYGGEATGIKANVSRSVKF